MGSKVFIRSLSLDCHESDIERFLKGYGRIKDIILKKGYAFIEFDDYKDADDAVYELNGKKLLGEKVYLEIARGPRQKMSSNRYGYRKRASWIDKYGPPTRTGYRLIVENLSSKVSWQDLKDYMRRAGEVTYADAHKQRRNEGVVEFASYSDMKSAFNKLNDSELCGRRIHLVQDCAHSRRSDSRSHSRSRSPRRDRNRSYSRSRSRSRSPYRSVSRDRSRSISRSRSRSVSRKSRNRSHSSDKSRSSVQQYDNE